MAWRTSRVEAATQGDWVALEGSSPARMWDGNHISLKQCLDSDSHDMLHDHYSSLFSTGDSLPPLPDTIPPSPYFSEEELRDALGKGKAKKSVGEDEIEISLELLRALVEVDHGCEELLRWFSCLLHSGQLPDRWQQTAMILIPKVSRPVHPRETMPISISSAAERVFCRLTLRRCRDKLQLTMPWQCAGPHRQTSEYLHAVYRLLECERGCGLAVVKVDIAKAVDTVKRDRLVSKLREYLGDCEEMRVWHTLLSDTSTTLNSPWGTTSFATRRGRAQLNHPFSSPGWSKSSCSRQLRNSRGATPSLHTWTCT